MNNLTAASKVLAEKKIFMASFMNNYVLKKIGVPINGLISTKKNFNKIIDFCLQTRQRWRKEEYKNAQNYFSNNFGRFKRLLNSEDIENLKILVYNAPGVGQKIGSLILEVFIHYAKFCPNKEKDLFVPIDSHVKRILEDSFKLTNVPSVGTPVTAKKYKEFQQFLSDEVVDGQTRIIFDYLWFIGKVFCAKLNHESNIYSRGFRLCSMCWIQEHCQIEDKWL